MHHSAHIDEAVYEKALDAAEAIDATVASLGYTTQAFHHAADPTAPTWTRSDLGPIVAGTAGDRRPAHMLDGDRPSTAPEELIEQASYFADDLDSLTEDVAVLNDQCTHGWSTRLDPATTANSSSTERKRKRTFR